MPDSGRGLRLNLEWRTTLATLLLLPLLTGLGVWQLQRADEKALLAAAWEQRQSQAPAPLADLWEMPPGNLAYLPVVLSGMFLEDQYFLLDNRTQGGRFGFEVLGILKLDGGGGTVLVNRGWLPADPGRRALPTVTPVSGRVELTGHIYIAPGAPYLLGEQQLGPEWPKVLQAVEMDKILPPLEAIAGQRVFPYPVRINAGEPGALKVDWQLVNVSADKHRAYAVQWFTMAAVLLLFFLLRSTNVWELLTASRRDRR